MNIYRNLTYKSINTKETESQGRRNILNYWLIQDEMMDNLSKTLGLEFNTLDNGDWFANIHSNLTNEISNIYIKHREQTITLQGNNSSVHNGKRYTGPSSADGNSSEQKLQNEYKIKFYDFMQYACDESGTDNLLEYWTKIDKNTRTITTSRIINDVISGARDIIELFMAESHNEHGIVDNMTEYAKKKALTPQRLMGSCISTILVTLLFEIYNGSRIIRSDTHEIVFSMTTTEIYEAIYGTFEVTLLEGNNVCKFIQEQRVKDVVDLASIGILSGIFLKTLRLVSNPLIMIYHERIQRVNNYLFININKRTLPASILTTSARQIDHEILGQADYSWRQIFAICIIRTKPSYKLTNRGFKESVAWLTTTIIVVLILIFIVTLSTVIIFGKEINSIGADPFSVVTLVTFIEGLILSIFTTVYKRNWEWFDFFRGVVYHDKYYDTRSSIRTKYGYELYDIAKLINMISYTERWFVKNCNNEGACYIMADVHGNITLPQNVNTFIIAAAGLRMHQLGVNYYIENTMTDTYYSVIAEGNTFHVKSESKDVNTLTNSQIFINRIVAGKL